MCKHFQMMRIHLKASAHGGVMVLALEAASGRFRGRVQYAYIEEPKTAQIILTHPNSLRHKSLALSEIH